MNIKVEKRFRHTIEKRLEEGWCLEPGSYFSKDGTSKCCALGAFLVELPDYKLSSSDSALEYLAKKLGISISDVIYIALGFDKYGISSNPFFALGKRLRADYCVEHA